MVIEDLHNGSTSSIRIGSTLSISFTSTCIDWIMERVASKVGFSLGNAHFTDLDYADDVAVLSHEWMTFIPP